MALKTLVKLNNVTNLSDARYGAGMGVEWIGYPLVDQVIDIHAYNAIKGWLSGTKSVGEFGNASLEYIKAKLAEGYSFDLIETSNLYELAEISMVGFPVVLYIKAGKVDDMDNWGRILDSLRQHFTFILLDVLDITLNTETEIPVISFCQEYPVILSGNFHVNVIDNLLEIYKPVGIALLTTSELRPGLKDFGQVADLLEVLEEA